MTPHDFTHDGKLLVLRVINKNQMSGPDLDFYNPIEPGSVVECPDWEPTDKCGNGLHGWPWGLSRSAKEFTGNKIWQVVEAEPGVGIDLGGKSKWPKFTVVYSGDQLGAMKILMEGIKEYTTLYGTTYNHQRFEVVLDNGMDIVKSDHCTSAVISTYDCAIACNSGSNSTASCDGKRSVAVTNGWMSSSEVSSNGIAVASGFGGKARAGVNGVIVLRYSTRDGSNKMRCAEVVDGENGTLKPNVWYTLNVYGEFIEL